MKIETYAVLTYEAEYIEQSDAPVTVLSVMEYAPGNIQGVTVELSCGVGYQNISLTRKDAKALRKLLKLFEKHWKPKAEV